MSPLLAKAVVPFLATMTMSTTAFAGCTSPPAWNDLDRARNNIAVSVNGFCPAFGIMANTNNSRHGLNTLIIKGVTIVESLQHGTASIFNLNHLRYVPAPGYHGVDHMTVRFAGVIAGQPASTLIDLNMNVR